jgi:hypothetical protein
VIRGQRFFAEAESTQWFCVGVRFPFDKIVFNVSAEFIAEHITALFPKGFATRRAEGKACT